MTSPTKDKDVVVKDKPDGKDKAADDKKEEDKEVAPVLTVEEGEST